MFDRRFDQPDPGMSKLLASCYRARVDGKGGTRRRQHSAPSTVYLQNLCTMQIVIGSLPRQLESLQELCSASGDQRNLTEVFDKLFDVHEKKLHGCLIQRRHHAGTRLHGVSW